MSYGTGTLTGTYYATDGVTPDRGFVNIIPNSDHILDATGEKILGGPVAVRLGHDNDGTWVHDGHFSIELPATEDATLQPATGRQYRVVYSIDGRDYGDVVGITLATGQTRDMSAITSAAETIAEIAAFFSEEDLAELRARLEDLETNPGASSWDTLADKPSTFPPSSHTHATGDITGLASAITTAAASGDASTLVQAKAYADAINVDLSALIALAEESSDIATLADAVAALAAAPPEVTQAQLDAEASARASGDSSTLAAAATDATSKANAAQSAATSAATTDATSKADAAQSAAALDAANKVATRITPQAAGRAARWIARLSDRTRPLFYDSFDRADVASPLSAADSGHAWTAVSGTWGITNHRAALRTGTEGCATVNLGVPADFIEGDLFNAPSGVPDPGLLIRCVDANNYLLVAHETTFKLNIWKKVAGAYTTIGTITTHSTLYSFGQTPFLRADYQRGTGKITATIAGANGLRYTVTATLGSSDRTLFELDTHVGLRSGTSDFGSGYTNLIAGVK